MQVDVIIPTWKNEYWLKRCLRSLAEAKMPELNKVIVVDNGGDYYESNHFTVGLNTQVVSPGKNLGWTGGLAEGLKYSDTPLVMFMNDDAEFERMPDRLALMSSHFIDPDVAAVGPATGIATGRQSVAGPDTERVNLLIGFCVLVRRDALEEVGGVDTDWDTGDDFDLSIRFGKAGKKLMVDRRVFVYHHAFKTGERIYGDSTNSNGWNSPEQISKVVQRLILTHGLDDTLKAIGKSSKPSLHREVVLDADN